MNDNREMAATDRRQTIDEAVSDLIGRYPGTIQRVDSSENMAMIRLHRKDSTWVVCLARAEARDA